MSGAVDRLAAVLVTDVGGSDALAAGAQPRLSRFHRALPEEVVRHGGRIVHTEGDRFVAEFTSPVRAVICGLGVLQRLGDAGVIGGDKGPLGLRMGVAQGPLLVADDGACGGGLDSAVQAARTARPDSLAVADSLIGSLVGRTHARAVGRVEPWAEGAPGFWALAPNSSALSVPVPTPPKRDSAGGGRRGSRAPRVLIAANLGAVAALAVVLHIGGVIEMPWAAPLDPAGPIVLGGTLDLGWHGETGRYRVYGADGTRAGTVVDLVTERLVEVSTDGRTRPLLVEGWRPREGGRVLELALRSGVRFHDTACTPGGRDAVARDLAWSLRLAQEAGILGPNFTGFEVAGERRITARLVRSGAFRLRDLGRVRLVPDGVSLCKSTAGARLPVGTGPFRFAGDDGEGGVHLARFDDYWRQDERGTRLPYLDGIRIHRIAGPARAVAAIDSGRLHAARVAPSRALEVARGLHWGTPQLQSSFATAPVDVLVVAPQGVVGLQILLLLDRGLDRSLRRRLAASIDREELASSGASWLSPVDRFLEEGEVGFEPNVRRPEPRAELSAVPDHFTVAVVGDAPDLPEIVEGQLRDLFGPGVEVAAQRLQRRRLARVVAEARLDAVFFELSAPAPTAEPYPWLIDVALMASAALGGDEEIDAQVEVLRTEPRRELRRGMFAELERVLLNRAVAVPIGRRPRGGPTDVIFVRRGAVSTADPLAPSIPSLEDLARFQLHRP